MEKLVEVQEFQTFERCPHDEENPYSQISNKLIRDISISPNCRWMLIYMLSNKNGWKMQIKQIMLHVKKFIGRDGVYKLVNEAIEAGYIQRKSAYRKNSAGNGLLKGFVYIVSESPKFKKFLRCPEIQDPELQDPEETYAKEELYVKNTMFKKEQQQKPVAAKAAAAVFPCLEKEKRISSRNWSWFMNYPEEEIKKAIKYADEQERNGTIIKSFTACARWYLREGIQEEIKVDATQNKDFAKACADKIHSQYYALEIYPEYAMIHAITGTKTSKPIKFSEKNFKEKLKNLLLEYKFTNKTKK